MRKRGKKNDIRRFSASAIGCLLRDDAGQDLVEYALLAAFIGVAGWAVLMIIPESIGAAYESWIDPDSGVPSLWDPPEPTSSGS